MSRVLPGAEQDFTEFAKNSLGKSYNGTCGEFAEASAVHIVAGIDLTPDAMTTILNRDIEHGWTASNGAEPLISIAHDLDLLKLIYTLYNYPGPSNWEEIVKTEAGYQPVIMEVANGQNLAGDEKGLQYHFITVVGVLDNGNYICCDGDNSRRTYEDGSSGNVLAEYTPSMIIGAQPCGLIVLKYPQKSPYGYEVQSDGSIIYNATDIHLIGAVAAYVRNHNVQEEALAAEFYYNPNESCTPFTNNLIIGWNELDKAIVLNHGGEAIAAMISAVKAKE